MDLSECTIQELMDEIHKRYDEFVFMGIIEQKSDGGGSGQHAFQSSFKAPTVAEAIGMTEFLKHSLLESQLKTADVKTTLRKTDDSE